MAEPQIINITHFYSCRSWLEKHTVVRWQHRSKKSQRKWGNKGSKRGALDNCNDICHFSVAFFFFNAVHSDSLMFPLPSRTIRCSMQDVPAPPEHVLTFPNMTWNDWDMWKVCKVGKNRAKGGGMHYWDLLFFILLVSIYMLRLDCSVAKRISPRGRIK